jgi:hypothetical protein
LDSDPDTAQSSQTSGSNIVQQVHESLSDAKSITQTLSDLADAEGFMGLGGDSVAAAAAGAACAAAIWPRSKEI